MKETIEKLKELPAMVWVIWGLIALLLYSLALGGCQYRRGWKEATESLKTDTVTVDKIKWDTVEIPTPIPQYQYIVKHKTDTFPIIKHDTVDNTAVVEVPITRKVYSDSLYRAVISGYKPSLDSIDIYQKTITHTQTITKTVTDKRKWAIGLQGGYGYGLKSKDFQPFIGVGISYRIF